MTAKEWVKKLNDEVDRIPLVCLKPTNTPNIWEIFDKGTYVKNYDKEDFVCVNDFALKYHQRKMGDFIYMITFDYNIIKKVDKED